MSEIETTIAVQTYIAEFSAARNGIRARVDAQYKTMALAVTISAVVVGWVLDSKDQTLFLVVPLVVPLLYLCYVDHTKQLNDLNRYIADHISVRLRGLGKDEKLMSLETFLATNRREGSIRLFRFQVGMFFWAIPGIILTLTWFTLDLSFEMSARSQLALWLSGLVFTSLSAFHSCWRWYFKGRD